MNYWLLACCKIALGLWIVMASLAAIYLWRSGVTVGMPDFIWEFCKVVLGPFVGAGLAFAANHYFHERRKLDDQRSAVRAAAFAIRAIHDDFVNYRHVIRSETARLHQFHSRWPDGPAPIWAYARPLISTFSAIGPPDLRTLHFLLDRSEGKDAFTRMQNLERAYKDLANAHAFYVEAAEEIQTKLEGIESVSWEADGLAIGRRITAKAQDAFLAVLIRIDDESLYQETYAALVHAATIQFDRDLVRGPLLVSDKLQVENQPPLPEHIAQCLTSME